MIKYFLFFTVLAVIAACGTKAQSPVTATLIASPLAGFTCFAVGTGGISF